MISFGVPFGAHKPCQNGTSTSATPVSVIVGTSGMTNQRFLAATPNAFNCPLWTKGRVCDASTQMKSIWPPNRSCTAGAPPRYCTIGLFVPVLFWKSIVHIWAALPTPIEPADACPGFALSHATNSLKLFAGKFLRTDNPKVRRRQQCHGFEIIHDVISEGIHYPRPNIGRPLSNADRVSIGLCAGYARATDRSGSPGNVLDNKGLAKHLAYLVGDDPCHGVSWPPRRKPDDDRDRARRIVLCHRACNGARGNKRGGKPNDAHDALGLA